MSTKGISAKERKERMNRIHEAAAAEAARRQAEWNAMSAEDKRLLHEESVKGLDPMKIPVRAELTEYQFVTDKKGNAVLNFKNRVQFESATMRCTWYNSEGKEQYRNVYFKTSQTGVLQSIIINVLGGTSADFTTNWAACSDMSAMEDLIFFFNEKKEEETLKLDAWVKPGTEQVVKAQLESRF